MILHGIESLNSMHKWEVLRRYELVKPGAIVFVPSVSKANEKPLVPDPPPILVYDAPLGRRRRSGFGALLAFGALPPTVPEEQRRGFSLARFSSFPLV